MAPRKDNLEKRIKRFQQVDEEKIPEMLKTIEGFVKSRNTFTESEFHKFEPLFKRPVPVSRAEHANLEKELYSRISPFEPIRVVSDVGDANGNHEILMTFPSRLNNHNVINNPDEHSTQVVDTFANKVDNPNPLNLSAEQATDNMMRLVSKSITDKNSRKQNAAIAVQADKQINEAKGQPTPKSEGTPVYEEDRDDSIDDFDFDSIPDKDDDDDDELDFEDDGASLDDLVDDED